MLAHHLLALRRALLPLAAFAKETRRTLDPTDQRQARRFAHLQDVEAALTAGADLYDRLTAPADTPTTRSAQRILAATAWRLGYPAEVRRGLATVTHHQLPAPAVAALPSDAR